MAPTDSGASSGLPALIEVGSLMVAGGAIGYVTLTLSRAWATDREAKARRRS